MTRFLSTVAAVALLAAPIAATAQTGGIPGGATQAPNPSPASSSVSQPRPAAAAPAPMPAATPAPVAAPATPATKPMPMKPMRHGKAKPMMHHAAKPMAGKGRAMTRSRDSQDNAVDALNAQSLARAQGR